MAQTLGYLGTGHLASYTIAALRNGGHAGRIILSPRNADVAADLAERHGCLVAGSNQDVIDRADIIVLSVRPHQLETLLAGLTFRSEQIVLSAIAGVSIAKLKTCSSLPETIVRFMPSSFIEAGDTVWPIHPANPAVEALLAPSGKLVVFGDEDQFDNAVLASCAYAWTYSLMDELQQWFIDQGWPLEIARDMVVRHLRGATTYALANPDTALGDISKGIATDGTYTKAGLDHLKKNRAFEPWRDALSIVAARLKSD